MPADYGEAYFPANISLLNVNNRTSTKENQNDAINFVLVFLLLTLNIFHTFS